MSHVTRTPLSRSKGQLVADVLNSQHAGTGATWRINAKTLSTCAGWGGRWHILLPHTQLVLAGQMPFLSRNEQCESTKRMMLLNREQPNLIG